MYVCIHRRTGEYNKIQQPFLFVNNHFCSSLNSPSLVILHFIQLDNFISSFSAILLHCHLQPLQYRPIPTLTPSTSKSHHLYMYIIPSFYLHYSSFIFSSSFMSFFFSLFFILYSFFFFQSFTKDQTRIPDQSLNRTQLYYP